MRFSATRFASASPWAARAILLAVGLLMLYGLLGQGRAAAPAAPVNPQESDTALYGRIVERVHAGEGYYSVAGDELRARGYPTRPFLTWRLPTLAWFLALFPTIGAAEWLLRGLFGLLLVLWLQILHKDRPSASFLLLFMIVYLGTLWLCSQAGATVYHEVWSGVCIGLSLALYGKGHRWAGLALGLLALFIRELALPYAAVMLLMAWRERRFREMAAWAAGCLAFAGALALHASVVATHFAEGDMTNSWVSAGGWPFVLSTARWNAFLLLLPAWVTALVVPLALLGLAGWRGPLSARVGLTVGCYLLAFLVIGQPSNFYWGLMYAFIAPLGLPYALPALGALAQRARLRRSPAPQAHRRA